MAQQSLVLPANVANRALPQLLPFWRIKFDLNGPDASYVLPAGELVGNHR